MAALTRGDANENRGDPTVESCVDADANEPSLFLHGDNNFCVLNVWSSMVEWMVPIGVAARERCTLGVSGGEGECRSVP